MIEPADDSEKDEENEQFYIEILYQYQVSNLSHLKLSILGRQDSFFTQEIKSL